MTLRSTLTPWLQTKTVPVSSKAVSTVLHPILMRAPTSMRHIRYQDAYDLKPNVCTEFNIEGNPIPKFVNMVLDVKPAQVTLVPDAIDALTSSAGWDTFANKSFLTEIIAEFKRNNIRTSIFINPDLKQIEGAKQTGADRIELYTEAYASSFSMNKETAIAPYVSCANLANEMLLAIHFLEFSHDQHIFFFSIYLELTFYCWYSIFRGLLRFLVL